MKQRLSLPSGLNHLIEKRDGPDRRGRQSEEDASNPTSSDSSPDEASPDHDRQSDEERRRKTRRETDHDSV